MPTAKKAPPKVAPEKAAPGVTKYLFNRLTEPSTWAGLLTLGAMFATGGTAAWLNAGNLPTLISGIGLVLAKEGT